MNNIDVIEESSLEDLQKFEEAEIPERFGNGKKEYDPEDLIGLVELY